MPIRFFFNWLAVVSGLLATVGCARTGPKGDAVRFGPVALYRLHKGQTKELAPDAASTKTYERQFNAHPTYNQPLYRIVAGGPQTVYLGLVLPPIPKDLAELTEPDSVWRRLDSRSLPGKARMALLADGHGTYNVRYLGPDKAGNTFVINLTTADSVLAQSYYRADSLFKGDLLL